jgi:WD40 repeat protein
VVGGWLTYRYQRAIAGERHSDQIASAQAVRNAADALQQGDFPRVEELLKQTDARRRDWLGRHLALRLHGPQVVLPGESVATAALRFSQDSRTLVSTGFQGYIRTWDGKQSQAAWLEPVPLNAPIDFQAAAFDRSGNRLAYVLVPTVELVPRPAWTLVVRDRSGDHAWRVLGIPSDVHSLTVAPAGNAVTVATYHPTNGTSLEQFQFTNGKWNRTSLAMPFRIWALAYSPDGKELAAGGERGWTRFQQQRPPSTLRWAKSEPVQALEYTPDGRILAIGIGTESASKVELLTLSSGQTRTAVSLAGEISDLSYDGQGKQLAVATSTGNVTVWDSRNWTEASTLSMGYTKRGGPTVELSPDGSSLAVGDKLGRVEKWQFGTDLPQQIHLSSTEYRSTDIAAALPFLRSDQTLNIAGSVLTRTRVGLVRWRPAGWLTHSSTLDTHVSAPIALAPNGRIAAVGEGEAIRVRAAGDATWRVLPTPTTSFALGFSADSATLAAGDGEGRVTLWDTRCWERLAQFSVALPSQQRSLVSIQFLNSEQLQARTADGTVFTWNAK